ncbi:hypothetical protein [Streptomyces sp. NPDC087300]
MTASRLPFARLDHESRLRLHALLRRAIDDDATGETTEVTVTPQEEQR